VNAVCTNNNGIASCVCRAGFTGDGRTCTLVPISRLARYLVISRVDGRNEAINLAEVEIYSDNGVQIPRTSITPSLSSTYMGFGPRFLTDGLYTTSFDKGLITGGFSHTLFDSKAWVQLDMGSEKRVTSVKIVNRGDGSTARAIGLKAALLDGSRKEIDSYLLTKDQPTYVWQIAAR
jgi:hypothetical protein